VRVIKRPVKRTPRKQLRAAAQRAVPKHAEEDYFSEEPNVKLSRAFVVVLLLHVVAVGGIFAFSSLKDRQNPVVANKTDPAAPKSPAATAAAQSEMVGQKGGAKQVPTDVQKLIEATNPSAGIAPKPPSATQSANPERSGAESNKTYVVQSGDSPAKIAKKFKVSFENLLKVNNIDDPKKLKIGQTLTIPIR
jgi:nucleoid-associated protein YgaU